MKILANNFRNLSFRGFERKEKDDKSIDYKFFLPKTDVSQQVFVEIAPLIKKNGEYKPNTRKAALFELTPEENTPHQSFTLNSFDESNSELLIDEKLGYNDLGYRFITQTNSGETESFLDAGVITNPQKILKPDLQYTIINTKRPIIKREGVGQLIMTDIYDIGKVEIPEGKKRRVYSIDKEARDDAYNNIRRNHVNKYGGNLLGIALHAKDMAEKEHIRTIIGMPFTKDRVSSHKYWTQNPYVVSSDLGTLDDFKKMQVELFKNGINYCFDAALVNEGLTGARFQHILKWGEKSPFYYCFSIDGKINLPILPDDKTYVYLKLVNPPNIQIDEDWNYVYDKTKPCYIQFYDHRLVDDIQADEPLVHFDEYRYPHTLRGANDSLPYYDAVAPYCIEVSHEDMTAFVNKYKIPKGKCVFTYAEHPEIFDAVCKDFSEIWNITSKRKADGVNAWDGNVDIPKAKFFLRPSDTKKFFDAEDKKGVHRHLNDKLLAGVAMVQDYAMKSMEYWSNETRKAQLEYCANLFKYESFNNMTVDTLKKRINYYIMNGDLPKTLYEELPNGEKKLKLSDELLQKIIDKKYVSSVVEPNMLLGEQLEDAIQKLVMSKNFQTFDCEASLGAVLASPYVSDTAFTMGQLKDNISRFDKMLNDPASKHVPEEYRDWYVKFNYLLLNDVSHRTMDIAVAINNKLNTKMFDETENLTQFGSYLLPYIVDQVFDMWLNTAFNIEPDYIESDSPEYDYCNNVMTYTTIEEPQTLPTKRSLKRIRKPEDEVKLVYNALSRAIAPDKIDPEYYLGTVLVNVILNRFEKLDTSAFMLADAILDKSQAGLGIRIDASKDVSEYDDVRSGKLSPDAAWDNVTEFWSTVVDRMLKINPHTLSFAEITDLSDFNNYKNHSNGDKAAADLIDKITAATDYTYFFSRLANYTAGEAHEKEAEGSRYNNLGNIYSFYSSMVEGWDTSQGKLRELPLDGINNSYIFADNHDKPRIVSLMALNMERFHCSFDDYKSQREACEFLDFPLNRTNFEALSSKGIAVGKRYQDAIFDVIEKDERFSRLNNPNFKEDVKNVIRRFATGGISDWINLPKPHEKLDKKAKNAVKFADTLGARSFEITLPEVLREIKGFNNNDERKVFNDAVLKSLYKPAMEKYLSMYKTMVCLPGIPTDFAGDRLGATGYESFAKNVYQANRHMIGWKNLATDNVYSEFYKKSNNIAKLRTVPELTALNDGSPVVLPMLKGAEEGKTIANHDVMPILRYNDRGSVVIAAFTNAGLKCEDKDYDRYVREVPNRPNVQLNSICITPQNLLEENSKVGLKTGLTHGMQFKKYGDDETVYRIVNQKVIYKNGKIDKWYPIDYEPKKGEIVRIFSELKREDGKPIVIDDSDKNVAVFYAVPQN